MIPRFRLEDGILRNFDSKTPLGVVFFQLGLINLYAIFPMKSGTAQCFSPFSLSFEVLWKLLTTEAGYLNWNWGSKSTPPNQSFEILKAFTSQGCAIAITYSVPWNYLFANHYLTCKRWREFLLKLKYDFVNSNIILMSAEGKFESTTL